jgi:hypothetical protein
MSSTIAAASRIATASASSRPTAAPQGGILEGMDPSHYNPKDPIIMFIIQVCGNISYLVAPRTAGHASQEILYLITVPNTSY